jgi:predicted DNA-binding protein
MSQVRVSESTHETLRSLSSREGKSMQDIIDKAIEDYRRKAFLEGLSNDYRALQQNTEAWKEHKEEIALWDNTLMDGLNNE